MGRSPDELKVALREGIVSLRDIVETRYLSQAALAPQIPQSRREEYAELVGPLSAAYANSAEIIEVYYCAYIPAAVVLKRPWRKSRQGLAPTRYLEIEVVYRPEASLTTNPDIERGIWQARSYFLAAGQCRSQPRRNSITRNIFLVIVDFLSLADAQAIDGYEHRRTDLELPKINDELRQVGASIERGLLTEARHRYLTGTTIGALILGAVVVLIVRLVPLWSHVHLDTRGLGTVVAGGVGAVLSVMTRLTANNLRVDPGVGKPLLMIAGGFRPLIGGAFAFAVYVFVQGGLLPIRVTATGLQETYFFLGVAFLAGFSERFAQDAVTRAGAVISDTGQPPRTDVPPPAGVASGASTASEHGK